MRSAFFGSNYARSGFFWCIMMLFSLSTLFVSNGTLSASVNPQISAGWNHTIALKSDETVWTWGNNDDGKLGNGTNTSSNTPIQVSGLSGVSAITGGWHHTAALKSDGTVWTWGDNERGQLGNGTTTSNYSPNLLSGLSGAFTAIACGGWHSAVLKSDGTVWTWGYNDDGQLGNGGTTTSYVPVPVSGLSGTVTALAAGRRHTLALMSDGTVWGWGCNCDGQLGIGTTTTTFLTPVLASGLSGTVTAIACGAWHSAVLKSDGTVWTFGYNDHG